MRHQTHMLRGQYDQIISEIKLIISQIITFTDNLAIKETEKTNEIGLKDVKHFKAIPDYLL